MTSRAPLRRRRAPVEDPTAQRLRLRELWQLVLTADPTTLARGARDVKGTLAALAELQRWLEAYRKALEARTK